MNLPIVIHPQLVGPPFSVGLVHDKILLSLEYDVGLGPQR